MLLSKSSVLSAFRNEEPFSNSEYWELLRSFTSDVKSSCSVCKSTTQWLVGHDAKVKELEWKGQLLANETRKSGD